MKKAIKLINCLIYFGLVSNFSFAESYKNFVNEEIASELEEKGMKRIIHEDSSRDLVLLPNFEYSSKLLENRVAEKKKYTFISESLYLIDKSEILEKSNLSQDTVTIEDASRVVRSISKMEGMTYYSLHRKEESILYEKSYMIDSLETQNRIDDVNTGNADGQISYVLQDDHSFGECRYELRYFQNENSIYAVFKNVDSMGMGIFRVIDPEDMRINIIVTDCGDKFLLYLETETNCPKNKLIINKLEDSLIARVDAIYKWFVSSF